MPESAGGEAPSARSDEAITAPRPRARRLLVVLASVVLVSTSSLPVWAGPPIVDVGRRLGLPRRTESWDVAIGSIDGDGAPDVVISYHHAVVVYRNAVSTLDPIFSFEGGDPHGCTVADVDRNGLGDVYCTRGARHGTVEKANHLWMQTTAGKFEDVASAYGVEDRLGRGRRTTFLDLDHDAFPDLFVGNGFPRPNGRRSPNRTFVDVDGSAFDEVDLGMSRERGARCAQAADQNRDGWDDLLLCGQERLFLYRRASGGFRDVAPAQDVAVRAPTGATLADLNGDGRSDLVVVQRTRLVVFPGRRHGAFARPVLVRRLESGSWVTVGDIDGRRKPDIYVVQSCAGGSDVRDILLLSRRKDWRYTQARVPEPRAGCGDAATTVDLDRDRRDEVIVLNGFEKARGPVQVLSTSWD